MSNLNRHPVRRTAAGVLAGALALTGAVAAATPANAAAGFQLDRIAGADRYETSALTAAAFDAAANVTEVIVASGENGRAADALGASFLAGVRNAPVLLTPQAGLAATTRTALTTLRTNGATRVTIVGGPAAVSAAVEAQITALGYTVTRLGGADRFRTAELVVAAGEGASASNVGIVASGISTVDALAAGPLAFKGKHPVFLTRAASIPATTLAAMRAAGVTSVYIVGGEAVVSANVRTQLTAAGITVVGRLAGQTRSGTSVAIADAIIGSTFGFTNTTFNVASGARDGVDALSGAALSGLQSRPILVTDTDTNAGAIIEFATRRAAQLNAPGIIFGGFAAVSQAVETAIETAGGAVFPVALTSATVAQGGNLTGTITGEFSSVTFTGCGFTTPQTVGADTDTATAGRQFTIPVSATQAVGNCEVTFTFTPTGGGAAFTQVVQVAVTAGTVTSATARPELVSAQIVSTSGANQATPGTVVRYVFDEAVGAVSAPTTFKLYRSDNTGTPLTSASATIDANNPNAVLATFTALVSTSATAATGTTTANITLATVEASTVVDRQGLANPIGDASVGTGQTSTTTNTAGRTSAPDLVSLGFRAAGTGQTAVDFVFDQVAYVQNATAGNFSLVLPDLTVIQCTSPGISDPNSGTTQGGGITVGGNGTTTITVLCTNPGGTPGTTAGTALTASNVSRGVVTAGAVGTTPAAAATASAFPGITGAAFGSANNAGTINRGNVLTASDTPDAGTIAPDLVSVTLRQATSDTANDVVLFTFDQPVTLVGTPAAAFGVYLADGTRVGGDVSAAAVEASGSQVAVFFGNNTVRNLTGGNVGANAVTGVGGQANQVDEAATTNIVQPSATTQAAGRTVAPDLTAVAISQGGTFGSNFRATYTFDERVNNGAAITREDLYLVLADGSTLQCNAGAATFARATGSGAGEGDNQVVCTAYTIIAGQPTTAGAATNAQVGSAVLGVVDDGAVTDGTNPNPEGAEVTTGGTGTRTA